MVGSVLIVLRLVGNVTFWIQWQFAVCKYTQMDKQSLMSRAVIEK